jgi:hypothetical protein
VWGQSVIYIVSAVNIILFGVLLSHTIRWQPIQALSINQP